MPCRVGMTTNPESRKKYWESQVVGLSNWKILATARSKTKAQELEIQYAQKYGCNYHPGGDGPEKATWYVYYFKYTRTK